MLDIYVNIQREKILYSQGKAPENKNRVAVQIYNDAPGNPHQPVAHKQFYNLTEAQLQGWERVQNQLAAMRQ